MAISFSVFVDPNFNASQREAIGRAVVTYVFNRTKRGKGIDNEPFKNKEGKAAYATAYQDTRQFEIAGKNSRPINLTLTGDMLNSLEVLDVSLAGRIVVGIDDAENEEKARFMIDKGYNFLGLSPSEQSTILSRFARLTPTEVAASNITESVARSFLRGIFGG